MLRSDEHPLILDDNAEKESKEKEEPKRDRFRGAAAKSKIQRLNNQYIK